MEYLNSHISIHALREEGDQPARQSCPPPVGFLSTPSARRATLHPSISPCCTPKFLSTPSARRATTPGWSGHPTRRFLSTPSARRATWTFHKTHLTYTISIHALREEGDVTERSCSSTWLISIHALREEGDRPADGGRHRRGDFYPRPPRGGRPQRQERQS